MTTAPFLELVAARRGHFQLESGHHGELWLDLDGLFSDPARVEPFVASLADQLRSHRPDVICGPLLGGALLAQRVAQVMSAKFCFTERVMPADGEGLFQARYLMPRAFHASINGVRVALVDDVMSAGSALRGTYADVMSHGGRVVAAGALLVLGSVGESFFTDAQLPVAALMREAYPLFEPNRCPLCLSGVPLELVAT